MKFRLSAKRIIVAALAVWMSGIVVVFCCQVRANAAGEQIESCPLAKKSKCAKAIGKNSVASFGLEPTAFDCCAFPAKIFGKARKLENAHALPVPAKIFGITAPQFSPVPGTFALPILYQSFVRNRKSIYLCNRVFRI